MSTIVAISTAPGIGGIGIVRMSGKNTFNIIEKIFEPKNASKIQGYSIKYGNIVEPETNKIIDEVLVSYFKGPKSYTCEDLCEINTHGGMVSAKNILEICLKSGAELAEPGEFTKRAFLNGRIDLSQAEATIDIINARTKIEANSALNQLEGFLSKEIRRIKQKCLDVLVAMEVNIDYPEYDIPEITNKTVEEALHSIEEELHSLLKTFEEGKIIKEGINLAIIGTPNSGKSSLLNALLKEDRAIVTEHEGTTRDVIEESITISGIPFNIIDTAGIRKAANEVEKIGIEKAKKIAEKSDVVLAMFDISKNLDKDDKEILEFIKNKKSIIILNKTDLRQNKLSSSELIQKANKRVIEISVTEDEGINAIYDALIEMFNINDINLDNSNIVTNVRHKKLIEKGIESLEQGIKAIEENMPIDIVSINVREIVEALNEIIGENVSEDILMEIFSRFCLGK